MCVFQCTCIVYINFAPFEVKSWLLVIASSKKNPILIEINKKTEELKRKLDLELVLGFLGIF